MVNRDLSNATANLSREDPSEDFDYGPEEPVWDEEDGLFDDEEIVVG
ncbi:hypothetical protein [Sinomonas flava]